MGLQHSTDVPSNKHAGRPLDGIYLFLSMQLSSSLVLSYQGLPWRYFSIATTQSGTSAVFSLQLDSERGDDISHILGH